MKKKGKRSYGAKEPKVVPTDKYEYAFNWCRAIMDNDIPYKTDPGHVWKLRKCPQVFLLHGKPEPLKMKLVGACIRDAYKRWPDAMIAAVTHPSEKDSALSDVVDYFIRYAVKTVDAPVYITFEDIEQYLSPEFEDYFVKTMQRGRELRNVIVFATTDKTFEEFSEPFRSVVTKRCRF